jgi:hypothetical protein
MLCITNINKNRIQNTPTFAMERKNNFENETRRDRGANKR